MIRSDIFQRGVLQLLTTCFCNLRGRSLNRTRVNCRAVLANFQPRDPCLRCLRAEAKEGQILLSQRVNVALQGNVATEQLGALALNGLTQPVVAYNVPFATGQPALRVIEGGPQSI
jgi:hypothetical protein